MNDKKLHLSSDKIIAGVCGGLAAYLEVDVSLVRIAWVIVSFIDGIGIIAYILAALVIPSSAADGPRANNIGKSWEDIRQNPYQLIGLTLVIAGLLIFRKKIAPLIPFHLTWPLLLIFGGVVLYRMNRD